MRLDPVDDQLLRALIIDPRASFRQLGAALGAADRTIARRYSALQAKWGLRISANTDGGVLAGERWYARLRCAPGSAMRVAAALAKRTGTSWVALIAGGTEIVASIHLRSATEAGHLFMRDFPRTPQVRDVTAQRELRRFARSSLPYFLDRYSSADESLTADQVAVMRPALEGDEPGPPAAVDPLDEAIVALLRLDGRMPLQKIARKLLVSPSTAERRLRRLRSSGNLTFDVDLRPSAAKELMLTAVWMTVAPDRLEVTGQTLVSFPEVVFAAATTGRTNLCAAVLTSDERSFYSFLTETVGTVAGIRDIETAPCLLEIESSAAAER
uniref:Lrp/AsnC family transcriptional regulator n=1 Tax=Paractinoplanes polyasparticus TaxID=2856853 RepID=UPI001C84B92A|nr:AsnC family transcriptional regulator [Actinoplanes polyasparticus]